VAAVQCLVRTIPTRFSGTLRMARRSGGSQILMVDQILNDVLVPREDIIGAKSVTCRLLLASFPIVAIACSSSPMADDLTESTGPTLLLSVQPAAGAVDVSLTTGVKVRFNNSISTNVRSYIALHDGDCPGPVVDGRWTRTPDGTGLDFSPFILLIPGTEYTVHVGGGMTDGSGQVFDLRLHGIPLGGEAATAEMVLGPDGMGMGMDMMGQTITHTGLCWADSDGTYGVVFQFTTGG